VWAGLIVAALLAGIVLRLSGGRAGRNVNAAHQAASARR
jgi:hypothetical protein